MAKFNKLDVPHQWKDEFTKYPHGYTIFEALCKWTKQVDDMVDNQNNWNDYLDNFVENFEFELQEEVQSTIERWQSEGLLDDIIESALNTEIDNVKALLFETTANHKNIFISDSPPTLEEGEEGDIFLVTDVSGKFTPRILVNGSEDDIDYNDNTTAEYYKIGNMVFITIMLSFEYTGSDEGYVTITGLPFNIRQDEPRCALPVHSQRILYPENAVGLCAYTYPPLVTGMELNYTMSGGTQVKMTEAHLSKTLPNTLRIQGFYYTNQ